MKRVLSGLLALVIGLGCAVCALAADEPGLKKVTGLEAEWNGEVPSVRLYSLYPEFTPEHVTVTLSYEDGTSKVLSEWWEEWWGEGGFWQWYLEITYDLKTEKVTFHYIGSDMEVAYWNSVDRDNTKYIRADFLAGVPQTSFTFPVAFLEEAIADQQIPLKFNDRLTVLADMESVDYCRIFSFAPEKSGTYYFYTQKSEANPYALLRDADWNEIDTSSDYIGFNFCIPANLEAGKIYYLFVGALNGYGEDTFELVVSDKPLRMNAAQWVVHYLLGGWILARDNTKPGENHLTPEGLKILNFNYYVFDISYSYRDFQNALDTKKNIRNAFENLILSFFSYPNITHGDG